MNQRYKLSVLFSFVIGICLLVLANTVTYADENSGGQPEFSQAASQPGMSSTDDAMNFSPGLSEWVPQEIEEQAPIRGSMGDASLAPQVNVMPGRDVGRGDPYAWPGRVLDIWGNVKNGTPPLVYEWNFGDGSPIVSGTVSNAKYISTSHAYATLGVKKAILTVTDNDGQSDVDTVVIDVQPQTIEVEINAAIEDGLKYLYLSQLSDGHWEYGYYDHAATATAILCFENQGYLPIDNYEKNIYAEYVQAGLDYLTTSLVTVSVPLQSYCDPEAIDSGNTDANGIGVYCNCNQPIYTIGMVMMAFVGSGSKNSLAPDLIAPNGPSGIIGRTYRELVVDMVDFCAWAQGEYSLGRGGWRYGANSGTSDNSVTQWPAIGLEAAETHWEIKAPQCVKTELIGWINRSQVYGGTYDGLFYYSPYGLGWSWTALTGAGVCEMSYCDIPVTDSRFQRALTALENYWHFINKGFYYAMYAISKGCRISVPEPVEFLPGGLNWYDDYVNYLLPLQNANGSWPVYNYGILDIEWATLVLEKIVDPKPVAAITAPDSVPPDNPFDVDGLLSYHPDPDLDIVEWLWDFDEDDGIDWTSPDASGSEVTYGGYPLDSGIPVDTFIITLRVADNNAPADYAIDKHMIIVDRNNHRPIADPGGPYSAQVSEWITFDGTNSSDGDPADPEDHITSYSWDIDGDGVFGDCTDSICVYKWDYEYQGYVGLVVVDYYGAVSDTSLGYVYVIVANVDVEAVPGSMDFASITPDTVRITAAVRCSTEVDTVLPPVLVRFYDGDPEVSVNRIGSDQILTGLTNGDVVDVTVDWPITDTLPHMIYMWIDPWAPEGPDGGNLWEFNEHNNEDSALYTPYTAASVFMLPSPMRSYYINEVADSVEYDTSMIILAPPGFVTCYCYDFDEDIDPDSIDLTSLQVNGESYPSMTCMVHDDIPLWTGQKVLRMFFPLQEFIEPYGWVMDTTFQTVNITGGYVSGDSTFLATDQFMYVGHLTGDVDKNGRIDASDVVYLISYVFKKGQAPDILALADTNCDGRIIVNDIVYLINFYYKNRGQIGCH